MNATGRATRILLRGVSQKFVVFFAQNLPDLAPEPNKLMQLKCVAEGHSHNMFSDGGLTLGNFSDFAAKNKDFNAILFTFHTF